MLQRFTNRGTFDPGGKPTKPVVRKGLNMGSFIEEKGERLKFPVNRVLYGKNAGDVIGLFFS